MKRLLNIMLVCISVIAGNVSAQNIHSESTDVKGIQFLEGLSWTQVLERANAENKMIFLDCFTTWCAPCRVMDKNVYPQEKVGDFFNRNFLCVKVQIDRTSKDNENTRSWYNDAKKIEKDYSIDAFPTFLFLSPGGKPLHRAAGSFDANKFIAIAKDALNPETQSYTLAARYNPENMDTAQMKKVAISIRRSAPELAANIALTYLKKLSATEISKEENLELMSFFWNHPSIQEFEKAYIGSLTDKQLLKKNHIRVISTFLSNSNDKGFWFLFKNSRKVDSVMNAGNEYKTWFASHLVDNVIDKEEVAPYIEKAKLKEMDPDWNLMFVRIREKFSSEVASRIILRAKMRWWGGKKHWEEHCKYIVQYMEKFGKATEFSYGENQYAWRVFLYSNDRSKLEKALMWSSNAMQENPNSAYLDTYANILYKLGNKPGAIRWQQIAVTINPEDSQLKESLDKMKNNEPTWLSN